MKGLFIIFCTLIVTTAAFGQGGVLFNNNIPRRIDLPTGTGVPLGTPVGLYIVAACAAPGEGGVLVISTNINLAPGIFNVGTQPLPGYPAGATINVQVRAWIGAATYEDAAVFIRGSSVTFSIGPLSQLPTPGPPTGNGAWTTFSLGAFPSSPACPEPSTVILAMVSLMIVVLFRRRSSRRFEA